MSRAPLLIIAAGGTGGHMFPAQSLAEAMLAEGWRVRLSTDPRGARYTGGFPEAVERRVVRSGTFARGGVMAKIATPFLIAMGCLSATFSMLTDRPRVVVGFGGYPAIPAMSAAWLLRISRMIHEQNGVLGRVNHLFASRVNKVACSVWPTELPGGVDAVHTGNPVRQVVRDVSATPYNAPDADGPINVLIFGGSQGASILSEVVPEAIKALPHALRSRLSVSQQARDADRDAVIAAYTGMDVAADVQGFFDDVPQRLVAAHLVIARSGASSVADISAVGRPAIFVPLAIAIRDEQTANAKALEAAGGAVVMQEPEFTPEALTAQMRDILSDPPKARAMARAAATLGMPDAVEHLKREVLELGAAA